MQTSIKSVKKKGKYIFTQAFIFAYIIMFSSDLYLFLWIGDTICFDFFLAQKAVISPKEGLLGIHAISLCFSENVFVSPSLLNDSFYGCVCVYLGWFFSFGTLNMSSIVFCPPLSC